MGNIKVLIQKWVAVITMMVIFLGQYAITGYLATSYAIDLLATQSNNVQFRAYFKNGEEEITEIESSIDSQNLKLKIDVAVKTEGYFNGQISFQNAGFKLTEATPNNYIREIRDNVIYLNQINSEETASIEVGIEYFKDNQIQASTLSQPTTTKLNGEYTFSGGKVTIDGESDVKVIWKIPENVKAELAAKLQTNSTYKVNEENKKIVQFLTSSKLTNNAFPVKSTQITATIPTGATNVEVHKRTTKATNGDKDFTSANYNVENNVLTITINNEETDGKISWEKGVNDILVITYEYPENTDLSAQTITINEKITAQNNIELNAEQVQLTLNEEKDGIASISKQEGETSIYKGKIYSQEGRDISSYSIIYMEYVNGIKGIEITEETPKFVKEIEENGQTITQENEANVDIKSVKINKQNVANVLGNNWSLTIGEKTITNETITDVNEGINVSENGDIIVTLNDGIKNLTIITSKPVSNGVFTIETTKRVTGTNYTRAQLKEFTKLKDGSSIKYTKNNDSTFTFTSWNNINLNDTESKASLQCEQTALIASSEAKTLNFTAVLESSAENQDLYKNPDIKIKFPTQIKNVTYVQAPQLMYANGLQLTTDNYKVIEENGQKVLNIKLTGEQISYLGGTVNGTTILIKTNVELDPNATNSQEEIVMTYTNENATKYTDNGTQKVNIQIQAGSQGGNSEGGNSGSQSQSQSQSETGNNQGSGSGNGGQGGISQGENQNENTGLKYEVSRKVGGQEIAEGDTVKAGEIITYTTKITNQGTTDKNGVKIEAIIPENTTLIVVNPNYPKFDEVEGEYIDGEEYLKKEEQITQITKDNISIQAGKEINYSFMIMANENITEEKNVQARILFKENNEVKEEKLLSNKIIPAKFEIICMPYYRKPNEDLQAGYSYIYGLKIKNLTNEQQNNVKVLLNKSEALNFNNADWYIEGEENSEERKDKDEYKISIENNTLSFDSIPANKTIIVLIDISTKAIKENENQLMKSKFLANVIDSNNNIYRSNELIENIVGILASIESSSEVITELTKSTYVKSGDKIKYTFKIKNTGVLDAEKIIMRDEFSTYLDLESLKIDNTEYSYKKESMYSTELKYDMIELEKGLQAKKEMILEIVGIVKSDLPEDSEKLQITNRIQIFSDGIILAEKSETTYNVEIQGNTEEKIEDIEDIKDENNISTQKSISGVAWLDKNTDGQRDSDEETLSGITIKLYNIENNEELNSTITDDNGQYSFANISNGKYVVIFEYDLGKYTLTTYKAEGVDSSINSDAEFVAMTISGEKTRVASTDTITVEGNDITNIDIGLIEAKKFDLSLSKTISKIRVSNKQGNKTIEYGDTNLAKVEIRGKYLKGSVVMIEYKIKVTNKGELAGYAKKIVDNKPSELKFNSKLNSDWYQTDNKLYTTSLADEIIEPGETKEVTLVLTKTMTESNTGLTNNKAEIAEYYNSFGIADQNSSQEDDVSQADVIISVSTGKAVSYIVITILITTVIAAVSVVILKKIIKENVVIY